MSAFLVKKKMVRVTARRKVGRNGLRENAGAKKGGRGRTVRSCVPLAYIVQKKAPEEALRKRNASSGTRRARVRAKIDVSTFVFLLP